MYLYDKSKFAMNTLQTDILYNNEVINFASYKFIRWTYGTHTISFTWFK